MTIVTNQTELRNAISALETEIQIANDFEVSTLITITTTISIRSIPDQQFTIRKSNSLFGTMLRIQNGGSLTLTNIILDGNKENHPIENTTNRCLILLLGGTLLLQENTIIQNNNTYLEGGGVYLSGNDTVANHLVVEDNAIIRGCYARTNGGGIIAAIRNAEDTLVIRNQVMIEDNRANYGGGLYYRIYSEGVGGSVTIYDNPAFQNNEALNSGGAIAIFNIIDNPESINFNLPNTVLITNNQASNHGGGIYFVGANKEDELTIGSSRIENNQAGGYGGGVYTNWVITNFTGTRVNQNQAGTGGGLYLLTNHGGTLNIHDADISNNQATNGASGSGGGIWLNNRSTTIPYTLQIINSTISNNVATAQGGGVYVSERAPGLDILIEQVDVKNNTASTNGAGMLLASAGLGTIRILKSNIEQNASNNYGGGIYISNENIGTATVFMKDDVISNNVAEVQGGGLRLSSGQGTTEITLEDCTIEKNKAKTSSGGGIWCGGTHVNLSLTSETIVSQNETGEGNGGGIYFNSKNGILTLQDNSKIMSNLATQNITGIRNYGGGIYLIPGTLVMIGNSEIAFNQAKNGGGIATGEQSTATIKSGLIHHNQSILGGGIYNQNSTVYLESVAIYQNQASIGGGIYNQA